MLNANKMKKHFKLSSKNREKTHTHTNTYAFDLNPMVESMVIEQIHISYSNERTMFGVSLQSKYHVCINDRLTIAPS